MSVCWQRQVARMASWVLVLMLAYPHAVNAAPQQKIAAGSPSSKAVIFQFAVYFLPVPSKDPMAALRTVLRDQPASPALVDEVPKGLAKPVLMAHLEKDVEHQYAPPDLQSLRYFGRGLTREQALALQGAKQALILSFVHPREHVWSGLKAATEVMESLARETGGLLWDEETREVFTPDEWHKRRIAAWTETMPNVTSHTTIHVYESGEYVRAITLGMAKFGLPDVVVGNFTWSLNRNVGHLVNAFCQSLAETGEIAREGEYELDFRAIKNRDLRDSYLAALLPNATATAHLALVQGIAEEGDPRNRLIEITFDRYPGVDVHARQDAMMGSLFGWADSVKRIRHDEELLAASRRAKGKLAGLRAVFAKGLEPGGYIQVKAPFATPGGTTEWMWVEIVEWDGGKMRGLLKNEPFDIPGLHGGQTVPVREEDVFDYIRHYPDGRDEGNETGSIIEKMQGRVEKSN